MTDERVNSGCGTSSAGAVAGDVDHVTIVEPRNGAVDIAAAMEALRRDDVLLARHLSPAQADAAIRDVAEGFGLRERLDLQAGFASFHGHRQNVGKYFMTVNKRDDYDFIPAHSEGDSFVNIQLASFYCFENSTDGGETILIHIDDASPIWQSLREKRIRGKLGGRALAPHEVAWARGRYRIHMPADRLRSDDLVLQERASELPALRLVDVMAKPQKTYSHILGRNLHGYWDSIASVDFDALPAYARILQDGLLLRAPDAQPDVARMDNCRDRRLWRSNVDHAGLYKHVVRVKLAPGDLVIQNNLSWTHSATNWSPNSGTRNVAAAFA